MGLSNLPLASGHAHAKAFGRLGWTLDEKRRGRGTHLLLTKPGQRATLSIPVHKQVKRTIIADLIKLTGRSEEEYLRAFAGEVIPDKEDLGYAKAAYWIYEDMTVHTATVHRGDCRYCNHGSGMGRGRIKRDSRWLPCEGSSEQEIRSVGIQPNSMLRKCGASPCRDDTALAWLA